MIRHLADERPGLLRQLATAWLAEGARGVSLWQADTLVALWPEDGPPEGDLAAPIRHGRHMLGELRVTGLGGAAAQARLESDAALIGDLSALDSEVDCVAAELIEAQDQLLAIYRLNRATGGALSTDEGLRAMAQEAAGLVKAKAAFFYLEAAGDSPIISWLADGGVGPTLSHELCAQLFMGGTERTVCPRANPALATVGLGSLFLVPVQIRSSVTVGALGLLGSGGGADAPTRKLARAVAAMAGSLIERGMLYHDQLNRMRLQTEMDLARTVQLNLLPHSPPRIPGLEIYAHTVPALDVGGDLYDLVATHDGSLVFSLGDVTGKGIPAALLMAMTRTALRTKAAFLPNPDPLAILSRANQDLYDDFTRVEMFATVVVGQLLPREGWLHLANAGHAPVILLRRGAAPRLIEAEGVPIGVLPDPLCVLQSEPFGPGDLLVIASDGITEAQDSAGAMFGIERLMDLITCNAELPARIIGETIYRTVTEYCGATPQSDDQTLVVLQGTELC